MSAPDMKDKEMALAVGNVDTYTKTQPDGEVEQVTATITSRTNINWTQAVHLDNGDEIRTHHASPPNTASDPRTKLEILNVLSTNNFAEVMKEVSE